MKFEHSLSDQPSLFSSYFEEVKGYPQVDDVLEIYCEECLKSADLKLRLAPSILIACTSELLIVRLVKAIGDYLEDLNAVDNYISKNTMNRKHDYTVQMLNLGKKEFEKTGNLDQNQKTAFAEFGAIVTHLFDLIRLRRNEYVNPKPDMSFDDLPPENVINANVQGFYPYAKIILVLIDFFKKLTP